MVYHRLKHDPSDRFASLVDDLRTFIETEDVDDLERAVGIAAEEAHRARFKTQYGVDAKSGGRPCIARLWDEECRHTSLTAELPHQPPHADHASLWLADGTPAVYTMHLYELPGQHVRDIAACTTGPIGRSTRRFCTRTAWPRSPTTTTLRRCSSWRSG